MQESLTSNKSPISSRKAQRTGERGWKGGIEDIKPDPLAQWTHRKLRPFYEPDPKSSPVSCHSASDIIIGFNWSLWGFGFY